MADIKVAFEEMLARRKGAATLPTAVAHPCSEDALTGAVNAARAGLIDPVAKLVQAASSGFLSRSNLITHCTWRRFQSTSGFRWIDSQQKLRSLLDLLKRLGSSIVARKHRAGTGPTSGAAVNCRA
jgi:hypothetical protein